MSEALPRWLPAQLTPFWYADDVDLLRAALVGEAAAEGYIGMFAIACVLRNRVTIGQWEWIRWWGDTYPEVCLIKDQLECFWASWAKREKECRRALVSPIGFEDAHRAAADALAGKADITEGADHYFNPRIVVPKWASAFTRTRRIHGHDFYCSTLQ